MGWLAEHIAQRVDPAQFVPGCRSLLLVGDLYRAREAASSSLLTPADAGNAGDPIIGRIARYARGDDYHLIIKRRLHALCDQLKAEHPDHTFRAFTDTAPIFEREHAQRAGLGWVGRHTLMIHPKLGSFMLLGGIATSLTLEPPEEQAAITDHCGTCTRCIDACPTDAITDHAVDATRCIAYLTIEHRSPIDPALHTKIGNWLFGCDVCQEVCPHNSPRPAGVAANPAYAERRAGFDVLRVVNWTAEDRAAALKNSAIKRARLDMLKRNALIVAANALLHESLTQETRDAVRSRVRSLAAAQPDQETALLQQTARDLLAHHPAFQAEAPDD